MGYGIDSWAMNGIYSSIFLNEILALVTNRDIIMEIYRDIIIIYIYVYIYIMRIYNQQCVI